MGTFREFLFDGFVNPRDVWSKFNIKLLGILCSNTASGIFSLQVKTILSCRAGFISLFAVVPFLFSQSVGLSRLWAYLIDDAILPPSLADFWDIWGKNTFSNQNYYFTRNCTPSDTHRKLFKISLVSFVRSSDKIDALYKVWRENKKSDPSVDVMNSYCI